MPGQRILSTPDPDRSCIRYTRRDREGLNVHAWGRGVATRILHPARALSAVPTSTPKLVTILRDRVLTIVRDDHDVLCCLVFHASELRSVEEPIVS